MNEAGEAVNEQFQQAEASTSGALQAAHRQATTQLTTADAQYKRRLSDFEARSSRSSTRH